MKRRRKRKSRIIWITAIIILIIVLGIIFGVNRTKNNNSHVLNEPLNGDLSTEDLSQTFDTYSLEVANNTQQGLLSRTKSGNPKAGLAKSWKRSSDGLTWTFHLRKNLKWSNGDPITALDFVYNWRRTIKPETASQYAYMYSGIKNADEINSGRNKNLNSLGISAPNKTTVVVTLSHPIPKFENLMSSSFFFAQDRKIASKLGKKIGTSSKNQVYSGPYKLVDWNGSNKDFKLRPNKHYWNKKAVKNSGVDYQVIADPTPLLSAYKKGKLDRADLTTPQQIKKYKHNKHFFKVSTSGTDYFNYNITGKVPALKNLKIRQALNMATNRNNIAKNVTGGLNTPAVSLTPKGLAKTPSGKDFAKAASQETDYKYNLSEAKKLFAKGMKESGQKKLNLTIKASSDNPTAKPILDTVQQDWNKLPGLTAKEQLIPLKQRIQDTQNNNFQVSLANWGGDYAEPLTFLNMFDSDLPNNDGHWIDKSYNRLIHKASDTDALNNQKRTHDEIEAEKLLFQKAPIDPIDYTNLGQLRNPQVKSFEHFNSGAAYYYWMAKVNR